MLREYRPQLQALYEQMCGDAEASLDYATALAWLDERGVLGECSVQLPAPLYADAVLGSVADASIVSVLTAEHARETFID